MTAIAVPLFIKPGVEIEDAIQGAEEALEGTPGIIELRCDQATPRQMAEAIDLARVPVIVTVRPKWEGGFCEKTDDQRLSLFLEAIDAGADYVDVELIAWERSKTFREEIASDAAKAGTRLIISNHSFGGRPGDLADRMLRMEAVEEASVRKIAWKADSILCAVDALALARKGKGNVVALAMGEEGLISRLLARRAGAPFTFASAQAGKESAPGQPTVAELRQRYRWEIQSPKTQVLGVIGWPVAHSKSPHIHNAGFAAAGLDGVFVPLAVREGYQPFAAAVDALRAELNLRGASVTLPHKENAFRYLQDHHSDPGAFIRHLGVANTLFWDYQEEKLHGLNSDCEGALDALVTAWNGRRTDVTGKRIGVIGAGGAARAIVGELALYGATVVVYNRTRERADALVADMNQWGTGGPHGGKVLARDWDQLRDANCDAYINCTPLGMVPKVDGTPIDFDPDWNEKTVVFDTVYNPARTRLLKLAEKKGAKTVSGIEMFVRQAALQFKLFTGQDADVNLFRATLA